LRKGGASSGTGGGARSKTKCFPFAGRMKIIQRQKKKKRRCIPTIQEGTCSFVLKEEVSDDISFFIFEDP
jgi:hypothetical protein